MLVAAAFAIGCLARFTPGAITRDVETLQLEGVAAWVRETGSKTVIRANVVRAMGISEDLAVYQRAFRTKGETLTHICAVSAGSIASGTLFFSALDESDGTAVVWQAAADGTLLKTIQFADGVAQAHPPAKYESVFRAEKRYFLDRYRAATRGDESATGFNTRGSGEIELARPPVPAWSVLRRERIAVATFGWVIPVVAGFLAWAARPISRRPPV